MKVVYCDEGFWVDTDRLEEIDGDMLAPEISEDDINYEIERLDKRIEELETELEQLKRTVEFSEQEYLKDHDHWGECKWKIKAEAKRTVDHQRHRLPTHGALRHGVVYRRIPEADIDKAWKLFDYYSTLGPDLYNSAIADGIRIALAKLNIVACSECGGRGLCIYERDCQEVEAVVTEEAHCPACGGHGWVWKGVGDE